MKEQITTCSSFSRRSPSSTTVESYSFLRYRSSNVQHQHRQQQHQRRRWRTTRTLALVSIASMLWMTGSSSSSSRSNSKSACRSSVAVEAFATVAQRHLHVKSWSMESSSSSSSSSFSDSRATTSARQRNSKSSRTTTTRTGPLLVNTPLDMENTARRKPTASVSSLFRRSPLLSSSSSSSSNDADEAKYGPLLPPLVEMQLTSPPPRLFSRLSTVSLLGVATAMVWCFYNGGTTNPANAATSSVALQAVASGSMTAAAAAGPSGHTSSMAVAAAAAAAVASSTQQALLSPWKLLLTAVLLLLHSFGGHLLTGLSMAASWYMVQLTVKPVLTKALTAATIGIMGDYMAQWLEHMLHQRDARATAAATAKRMYPQQPKFAHQQRRQQQASIRSILSIHGKYHMRRGASIFADGLLLSGPLMHYGYELFEHLLPVHKGGAIAAMSHVLADSVLLDSIFVASTFCFTSLMEGYSVRQLVQQFRKDYVATMRASWATSIALLPIEFVCFRFLPVSLRVLAVNFIDVIWDAVISFMAHRNRNLEQQQTTAVTAPAAITATTTSGLQAQHPHNNPVPNNNVSEGDTITATTTTLILSTSTSRGVGPTTAAAAA